MKCIIDADYNAMTTAMATLARLGYAYDLSSNSWARPPGGHWSSRLLSVDDKGVHTFEYHYVEASTVEPVKATMCQCGVKAAKDCSDPWEPGCDLGSNPEHVRAVPSSAAVEALAVPDEKTGAPPPALMQEDSKPLSEWFAGKPDAMERAREAAGAIAAQEAQPAVDAQRRFDAAIRAADRVASGCIEDGKRHYIIQTARNEWNNPSARPEAEQPAVAASAQECERCGESPEAHKGTHWCDNQSFAVAAQPVAEVVAGAPFDDGSPNPCNALKWALRNCESDLPIGAKLHATTQAAQPGQEPAHVYLVATDKTTDDGMEVLFTRHEGAPPPLCEFETLYARPSPIESMDDVGRAFYKLTVHQRDAAWREIAVLRAQLSAAGLKACAAAQGGD